MKATLLMATVLVLAACGGQKGDAPAADTSASAPMDNQAPVMQDTTAPAPDSGMTHTDSSMARDSMAH